MIFICHRVDIWPDRCDRRSCEILAIRVNLSENNPKCTWVMFAQLLHQVCNNCEIISHFVQLTCDYLPNHNTKYVINGWIITHFMYVVCDNLPNHYINCVMIYPISIYSIFACMGKYLPTHDMFTQYLRILVNIT